MVSANLMQVHETAVMENIKGLMDISRAITSDLYLEDLLKLIVMVTAKVMGVEICFLWLMDESEAPKKMRLKATQAIDPEYLSFSSPSNFLSTRDCGLLVSIKEKALG